MKTKKTKIPTEARAYLMRIGRTGGRSRSAAKIRAAQRNGRKHTKQPTK